MAPCSKDICACQRPPRFIFQLPFCVVLVRTRLELARTSMYLLAEVPTTQVGRHDACRTSLCGKGAIFCRLALTRTVDLPVLVGSQQRQRANRGAVVDIENARRRAKRPGRRPVKRRRSFRARSLLCAWRQLLVRGPSGRSRGNTAYCGHTSLHRRANRGQYLYSRASSAKGLVLLLLPLLRQVRISPGPCKA